jgi:predicted transcriptional regulator
MNKEGEGMHDNWMLVNFEWVDSPKYRNIMCSVKGIQLVYDILRRYVIRDPMKNVVSRYIYDNIFSKNKLASSVSYTHIEKLTGMGRATIANCLKKLEENGYLQLLKIEVEKGNKQNIYVLGRRKPFVTDIGKEVFKDFWFIDDIIAQEIYEKKMAKLAE